MFQSKQKSLVEVCPQCCKSVDSSANRLVHDTCGHLKCRICLLQEITGCLLCVTEGKSKLLEKFDKNISLEKHVNIHNQEPQPRKSVITSLAIQIAEKNQIKNAKTVSVDKETCHLIKQTLEKDILFPTDIVKRSTGNFYHLKRIFSQRFFNEDYNKKHKACETEEKWSTNALEEESEKKNIDSLGKKNWKIPNHVEVQYYCKIHNFTTLEKTNILKHHMSCNSTSLKIGEASLHQCKMCNKSFKIKGKLNRHLKTHVGNSKFKCIKCNKLCTDNYALKTHERTHTQQKPFSCQYCEKKFSSLQNIKRHEKKHKDEKKFVCDDCGFRFITNTELKRHEVTHTNLKSFSCSICFSKFAFKRTLVRHLKIHDMNFLKIKCSQCDSTFRRKDNLERHIKSAHSETNCENLKEEIR